MFTKVLPAIRAEVRNHSFIKVHPPLPIGPSWSLIGRLGVGICFRIVELNFDMRVWKIMVKLWHEIRYVTDPHGGTINFKICIEFNSTTMSHQPPIPNSSQASAWSYMNIGRWIRKTKRSPTAFRWNFGRLNGWNIPLAKVVDFVPLGAIFGPGAVDPGLAHFQINV